MLLVRASCQAIKSTCLPSLFTAGIIGWDNAQCAPSRLNNVVVGPKVRDWDWRERVMRKSDNIFAKAMFIYIFDYIIYYQKRNF
jgi:hypothetical protein